MAEENSWKSKEDEEDEELDETVRSLDIYLHRVELISLGV